jgi:hypothetical protein
MNVGNDTSTHSVAGVNEEVELGEDLSFQRRWWRFERGAWSVIVLLLLCDVAGLFGRGPLANATRSSADGSLMVRYERIERARTPSLIKLELGPEALQSGVAQLFVSNSMVGDLGAERVIPQPERTTIGHNGLIYSFPAQSTPASVMIELRPRHIGVSRVDVGVPGHDSVHMSVFVFP